MKQIKVTINNSGFIQISSVESKPSSFNFNQTVFFFHFYQSLFENKFLLIYIGLYICMRYIIWIEHMNFILLLAGLRQPFYTDFAESW